MTKHYLTKEKLKELEEKYSNLVNVQRPEVLEELKRARELGDLSENADYESALTRQSELETRIQELESILKNYCIIQSSGARSKSQTVEIGSKVRIFHSLTNKEYTYQILGSLDADPAKMKISNESPIARAILGKSVGESYQVEGLKKSFFVTVLEILS
ncbi:hypothetical protein PVNG_02449 [Plasmodium vivax North Korean]|uniref:Transcription elongation factor GreA n=1 Tax=Plasmodium vivax North Korean TaxID=1035514 RepID=A0A0J9TMF6_PLAVI|nr:hypothetical protein PVNG_02449 [Plasmodium vivax North Korean]